MMRLFGIMFLSLESIKKIIKCSPFYGLALYIKAKLNKKSREKMFKATLTTYIKANEVDVKGIIHVGANTAQEMEEYINLGDIEVIYIDPIGKMIEIIKNKISAHNLKNHMAVQACCSNISGDLVTFHVASNNGESSSMLELGTHGKLHPDIQYEESFEIKTITLDDLLQDTLSKLSANVLVIDTQGADLKVLQGSEKILNKIDAIYIEVSDLPVYEGGATFDEIYHFLTSRKYFCHSVNIKKIGYGNAFFVRNTIINNSYGLSIDD